jgi:hypothetical protein
MQRILLVWIGVPVTVLTALGQDWKHKPAARWTKTDASEILSDSPWVKQVMPEIARFTARERGSRSGMGRVGGIRLGGIGIGGPGGPRAAGRGGGNGQAEGSEPGAGASEQTHKAVPPLTVRWESALPIQEARLKAGDATAPEVVEGYYTVSVAGLPREMLRTDEADLEKRLKSRAELRRVGKKSLRSTSAEVIPLDDALVVLFRFPQTDPIVPDDRAIELAIQIENMKISQSFDLDQMVFEGTLSL